MCIPSTLSYIPPDVIGHYALKCMQRFEMTAHHTTMTTLRPKYNAKYAAMRIICTDKLPPRKCVKIYTLSNLIATK